MNNSTINSKVPVPIMVKPIAVNNQIINTTDKYCSNAKHLNFLNSFKVNYYFLRAFGLWPFSFVRDSNGRVQKSKITKLDLLWFIASLLLYISASIFFIKNTKIPVNDENEKCSAMCFINKGYYIRIVFSLVLVTLSIGVDMCNRFKLVIALKMFVHFDGLVSVFSFLTFSFNYYIITLTSLGFTIGN